MWQSQFWIPIILITDVTTDSVLGGNILSVTYSVYSAVFSKYSCKLALHSEQVVTFMWTMKQMVMTQMVRVMSSKYNKHMRTIQTQDEKKQKQTLFSYFHMYF